MRIAYIGPAWGTSLHRADALKRLGHNVVVIDPWSWLGRSVWMARWLHHTGGIGVGLVVNRRLVAQVKQAHPELIWVDQGEFLTKGLICRLRRSCVPIVNYTVDNPFVRSARQRFRHYRSALPCYSLLAVVREASAAAARRAGCPNVKRIWGSADDRAHRSRKLSDEVQARYASDVVFVGTWFPERGPFMAELIRLGVPLSIYGDRWQKAREWPAIKPHWRGPGLYNDDGYAAALLSAKICLCLLSKGNRDLHTTRSIEIPSLGALLCAERTTEHLQLYEEGTEAVFWNSAQECAAVCRQLLADEPKRLSIASRGHERAVRNNLFNEPVMAAILKAAMDCP